MHNTQSPQISQKQDGRNIYAIMKTMHPPGYHHHGLVVVNLFMEILEWSTLQK